MTVTSIDIDRDKLDRLKALTGAKSNREVVDAALDIALSVEQKRELIELIKSHHLTPEWHEATKHGRGPDWDEWVKANEHGGTSAA